MSRIEFQEELELLTVGDRIVLTPDRIQITTKSGHGSEKQRETPAMSRFIAGEQRKINPWIVEDKVNPGVTFFHYVYPNRSNASFLARLSMIFRISAHTPNSYFSHPHELIHGTGHFVLRYTSHLHATGARTVFYGRFGNLPSRCISGVSGAQSGINE
uniref:Glycosyltransferase family 2 protein n=1 Tax=Steinernema glaseri TaxID=37863 RepID=A0A1I7Z741_9BILA